MSLPLLRPLAVAALLGVLAWSAPALADDDSDLPATLRRDYVSPITGPADDKAYAHGQLGIVRPGFGRASLYVAWRVMQLPPGSLAAESHERRGNALLDRPSKPYRPGGDEIDDWLEARDALVPTPAEPRPDFFRTGTMKVGGFELTTREGNCGPDAFDFATRTLRELASDPQLTDADRRAWIEGQDAVFARCTWMPGTTPAPKLPTALPRGASPKLKALRAYQHAAALFYSDDFEHARQEFDAIAATRGHPMRAWAALGAMRSVVRPATLDKAWEAAFQDAYRRRGLRGDALHAALSSARKQHQALANAAMKDLQARAQAIAADDAFAEVRSSAVYTLRRATSQLAPTAVVLWAMDQLDHVDRNPYTGGTLDTWTEYYPRSLPDRPDGDTLSLLRDKHAFYDWIVTVQGCGDSVQPPDEAVCGAEHAHAVTQWQRTQRGDWLLAALLTARQPAAADLPLAEAARALPRERPEWASVQFQAARVLKAQGRQDDALRMLDQVAASAPLGKRDARLVEGERVALGGATAPAKDAKAATVTERQIRAEYDRIASRYRGVTEYKVRHILVDSEDKAQRVLDRLHQGESFGQVARQVASLDPQSAGQGGELGWNEPAYFDPDFSKAMVALAPHGLTSAPVKTRFGWHVIEVTEVRTKAFPSYEEVHDRIAEALRRKGATQ